jgi:hypothetical protein
MQLLQAFFSRSDRVLHYLAAPLKDWKLPHYPWALHPDPTLPFTSFPYDALAGDRMDQISLPEELQRYSRMRAWAHESAVAEPCFMGRRLFSVSDGTRGSMDQGQSHLLSYRRRHKFTANEPFSDPLPHTPSQPLLVRLISHHLDELREAADQLRARLDAAILSYVPDPDLVNHFTPFSPVEAQWCAAEARVTFVQTLLGDVQAQRPFPMMGQATRDSHRRLSELLHSARTPYHTLHWHLAGDTVRMPV